MQKADKGTIKENNKQVLLNCLKNEDLSRTDLTERTGLSASTVGVLAAELLQQKIIFEKCIAQSSGGRKPVILSLNPQSAHILLLKLQQDQVKLVLLDLQMTIVYQSAVSLGECTQQTLQQAVEQGLDKVLVENTALVDTILGIGVSVPGMVDLTGLQVIYSARLQLENFPIGEIISHRLSRKIYLFRDTDAFMLGEAAQSEALHSLDSSVYIRADNGVGLSFMRYGEIVQLGRSGFELGHVPFEADGPLCSCGNYGCLETLVSVHAARRALRELKRSGKSISDASIDRLSLADIVRMANEGYICCRDILTRQYGYLGRAAALTVNLFAPAVVFIGGPLCDCTLDKEDLVRRAFDSSVLPVFKETKILFTHTDELACYKGIAGRIFDQEFFGTTLLQEQKAAL